MNSFLARYKARQFDRLMTRYVRYGDWKGLTDFLAVNPMAEILNANESSINHKSHIESDIVQSVIFMRMVSASFKEVKAAFLSHNPTARVKRTVILSPGIAIRILRAQSKYFFGVELPNQSVARILFSILRHPKLTVPLFTSVKVSLRLSNQQLLDGQCLVLPGSVTFVSDTDILSRVSGIAPTNRPNGDNRKWPIVYAGSRRARVESPNLKAHRWIECAVRKNPYEMLLLASILQSKALLTFVATFSRSHEIAKIAKSIIIRSTSGFASEIPNEKSQPMVTSLNLVVPNPSTGALDALVSATQFQDRSQMEMQDVTLWHNSIITKGEDQIVIDSGQDPRSLHVSGMSALQACGIYLNGRIPTQVPRLSGVPIERAIYFGGRVDTNWFHFLVEGLPSFLRAERGLPGDIPVAVRKDLPRSALELLSLVTDRSFVYLEDDKSRYVRRLHVAFRQATTSDSLFSTEMSANFDKSGLNELRSRVIDKASHEPSFDNPEKILVLRNSSYRRLRNANAVRSFLSQRGYVSIDTGQMSASDQIRIFNNAKEIVIQGGAAMGNLVFAEKRARVIVLVGSKGNQGYYWKSYCDAIELDDSQVIAGKQEGKLLGPQGIHSDFSISRGKLSSI